MGSVRNATDKDEWPKTSASIGGTYHVTTDEGKKKRADEKAAAEKKK